jgi:hypothetical protein
VLSQAEQVDVVAVIGLLENRLNEPAANFFFAILPFGEKLQVAKVFVVSEENHYHEY